MPIEIRAVNDADFLTWVAKAKEAGDPLQTAQTPTPRAEKIRLAQVQN
jgi:heme/copper-type cytochrome/quinol oxidase subunit 2